MNFRLFSNVSKIVMDKKFSSFGWQLFDSVLDVVEFFIFGFKGAFDVINGQLFSIKQAFVCGCFLEEGDGEDEEHEAAHGEYVGDDGVVSGVDGIHAGGVTMWFVD